MQQQTQQKSFSPLAFPDFARKIGLPLKRVLKRNRKPADEQAFLDALKAIGTPEDKIPNILALVEGMRKVDNPTENYLSDRIYVGGIGALDLILFQVLASLGHPDLPSSLAWLAFAISLPCAAGFLYVGLWKEKKSYPYYSPIHEKLALISVMAGGIATIATAWHFWIVAGILLSVVAVGVFIFCALYKVAINEDFEKLVTNFLNELNSTTEISHSGNSKDESQK